VGVVVDRGEKTLDFVFRQEGWKLFWRFRIPNGPCNSLSKNLRKKETDRHVVDIQCGTADIFLYECIEKREDILLGYLFRVRLNPAHELVETEAVGLYGSRTEVSAAAFFYDELFVVHAVA